MGLRLVPREISDEKRFTNMLSERISQKDMSLLLYYSAKRLMLQQECLETIFQVMWEEKPMTRERRDVVNAALKVYTDDALTNTLSVERAFYALCMEEMK